MREVYNVSSIKSNFMWMLFLTILSILFIYLKLFNSAQDIPGDLGDARFNIYILEHIYQWLRGDATSLISPPMFYPYPNVLAFSDDHAGSVAFYAAFRAIGFDPYDAFKGWFIVGYAGTFAAAFHVLLRLKHPVLVAGLGAFLFTFSLPILARVGHAQLTYRWAIPFAIYYTLRLADEPRPSTVYKLLAAICLEMLFSIYLGLFTFLYCAILFVSSLVLSRWSSKTIHVAKTRLFFYIKSQNWLPFAALPAAVLLVLVVLNLGFYSAVSRQYGFARSWDEIYTMAPRWQSYLMMDGLPYWSPLSLRLPSVPIHWEHALFMGLPLGILLVAALAMLIWDHRRIDPRTKWTMLAVAATLLVTFVLFLAFKHFTFYRALATLPGLSAIRVLSREWLVGLFLVVMLACGFLTHMLQRERSQVWVRAFAAFILLWSAYDAFVLQVARFSSAEARARIAGPVAQIRASATSLADKALAYVGRPDDNWYVSQIDGILIAQALGIPSLNGYSGNDVPGYAQTPSCAAFASQWATYQGWAQRHRQPSLRALWKTPLIVGDPECQLDRETVLRNLATQGPDLSRSAGALIELTVVSQQQLANEWRFIVRVANHSSETSHAGNANALKVSWSALNQDGGREANWRPRVPLPYDLEPGRHQDLSVVAPAASLADHNAIQFTFVVENHFWASDIGVAPLQQPLAPP